MPYQLKTKSLAKAAMDAARDESVSSLQPPVSGELETKEAATKVAHWLSIADGFVKEWRAKLKDYVREHGDLYDDGATWGPQVTRSQKRVSMKLEELVGLLAKHRVPYEAIDSIEEELKAKGIGVATETERFGWHK